MSENNEEDDKLIHKFSSGYVGERMPGKENLFILRNKQGFIVATAEKYNDTISAFKFHKERRMPRRIVNQVVAYLMAAKFRLSREAARELGVSVLKPEDGGELYLSTQELKHYGLNYFLNKEKNTTAVLNSLYPLNLTLNKNTQNCRLDLQGMLIKNLSVGAGSSVDIDLRGNHRVKSVKVGKVFAGKISLSHSSVERLEIEDDSRAEVSFHDGDKVLNVKIGDNFRGSLSLRKSYLRRLSVGDNAMASFDINTCIFYRHIILGKNCGGNLNISSVFARYFEVGDGFSGHLYGSSITSRQGIRNVYVGNDFSGVMDLSASKTVRRLEFGDECSGSLICISSSSVSLCLLGRGFSGTADFRESGIVCVSAGENCRGKFECADCRQLVLMNMPRETGYKIAGTPKPIKTETVKNRVLYWFDKKSLSSEYFKTYRKSWLRRIMRFF